MVVFDATMMLLFMHPDVNIPLDPNTNLPVENVDARISGLIEDLEKQKVKIIIPTPALSELLVRAGDATPSLINNLQKSSVFRIVPFDTLAAIEVSIMTRQEKDSGNKCVGVDKSTWAKLKYDWQIIAIAKVHRATAIYSDDKHIHNHCKSMPIKVIRLYDIPIPQKKIENGELDFKKQEDNIIASAKL
jgi:hypothetical protein